jgi:hypothetical protein
MKLSFEEFVAANQGTGWKDTTDFGPETEVFGNFLVVFAHGFYYVLKFEILDG